MAVLLGRMHVWSLTTVCFMVTALVTGEVLWIMHLRQLLWL